jgi:ABC-type sugar transport system permease subunit
MNPQEKTTNPNANSLQVKPRQSLFRLMGRLRSYYFLLPAVVLVGVFLVLPFLWTSYLSFTDYRGLGKAPFVGLSNYVRLVQDPILLQSLANTFLWLVGSLLLPVGIGLLVAAVTFNLAGGALYRLPFLLPYALSGAAVGVLWSFMLQGGGAVNGILVALGLGALSQDWLLTPPLNTLSMIVAHTWQATGVSVVLFLVGLQAIPPEPIEAARVDGAGGWTLFRHITLPLLRPMTIVVIGITLVNSLKTFDIIWVMTQGGPYRSSETLAVTMFRETFLLFRYGSGAAVAVVLSVIVFLLSWLYLRRTLRRSP